MSGEVETDELTGLDFRAELPCEHSMHNVTRPGYITHIGDQAVWDYRYSCPCGTKSHKAVCDAYRQLVHTRGIDCVCGLVHTDESSAVAFTPIPEATP